MQFILDGFEKRLRDFGVPIVVDAALLVNIGDLEVKPPLACPDFADAFEEFIEVVFSESRALFKALIIEDESLDDVFTKRLSRPNSELGGFGAADAVTD